VFELHVRSSEPVERLELITFAINDWCREVSNFDSFSFFLVHEIWPKSLRGRTYIRDKKFNIESYKIEQDTFAFMDLFGLGGFFNGIATFAVLFLYLSYSMPPRSAVTSSGIVLSKFMTREACGGLETRTR
jgi:hypothetical protein